MMLQIKRGYILNLKNFSVVAGLLLAVSFAACGSSDPCTGTSKCSADVKLTAEGITACQANFATGAACGEQNKALANCMLNNQVCGADNKTDGLATLAKCTSEGAKLAMCQAPDAGP